MHFTAFYTFFNKNLNAPLDIRLVMMAILKQTQVIATLLLNPK